MEILLKHVPKEFRQLFRDIVELTDKFCEDYLDEDYQQLTRDMAIKVCQKGSPVISGRPRSWACGIVHALGWVNFLHDPNTKPYIGSTELAKGFGVSQGTMLAKSKKIRQFLNLIALHPAWCIPDMVKDNPLVWMVEVNGIPIDIRVAPREIQEQAYAKGLIPYIPDDQEDAILDEEEVSETLKFPTIQHDKDQPRPELNDKDQPSLF